MPNIFNGIEKTTGNFMTEESAWPRCRHCGTILTYEGNLCDTCEAEEERKDHENL